MSETDFQISADLFDALPDPIVITDDQGRIVRVNRQVQDVFGYAPDELTGQAIEILLPQRFRSGHVAHRRRYAEQPTTRLMGSGLDLFARHHSGRDVPVDIMLTPYEAPSGRYVISVMRDITDRKAAEDELARSNAELEHFAYVAAHDLKAPLRTVQKFVELLQTRHGDELSGEAGELVAEAMAGAERMRVFIDDLLAYSRVESRAKPREPVDCSQILDLVEANLASTIKDAGARITRGELPVVEADRTQLVQVFQNLLANAIKFHGAEPPLVHVTASRRGDQWVLSVADNGIGIDREHRLEVFRMFRRVHAEGDFAGSGIGLATCRKIVERHGGQIWVDSEPGHGSTFHFSLAAMA
ncbi:MAG: ATP-binding protein [Phycisphaerae bacterium]|nr:ATP-binding protein [Phycisphaerae bacterium]